MDVKRSQSVPSDALSIECHELDKRMAEVLALREAVASLETSRQRRDIRDTCMTNADRDPCSDEQYRAK
jgi:hypothetical protein